MRRGGEGPLVLVFYAFFGGCRGLYLCVWGVVSVG